MRIVRVLVGIALLCAATPMPVLADDVPTPATWMGGLSPTARFWGMGHAGTASTLSPLPPLHNGGAVGIWAFNTVGISQTHNWESLTDQSGETYGYHNDIQAVSLHLPQELKRVMPLFAVGIVNRQGSLAGDEYSDWTIGIGLDIGLELGAGYTESDNGRHFDYRLRFARSNGGAAIRARLMHMLERYEIVDEPPSLFGFVVSPSVTYGAFHYLESGATGWSYRVDISWQSLSALSVEHVVDRYEYVSRNWCGEAKHRRIGWEVLVLGSFAYRWGDRQQDDAYYCEPVGDWGTSGIAIDAGNFQRWVRQALDIHTSNLLTIILDHIDLRYETAEFRHPDMAPAGLGDWSVKEWTVGLSNIQRLWSDEP
ncbi:MAG: hypothetical protein GF341_06835 [candidate division Zixibacteria bacterium]|nr:hypothetical protein [candidate division Zixibacteria bacterium]